MWVLPLLIVCLFAFLVAHCFLSVFENVVDVLFLCFAVDTKYNDGSPGREYYMDKALMVSMCRGVVEFLFICICIVVFVTFFYRVVVIFSQ